MEIFGIIGGLALGYIVVKAWDVEQANKKAKKANKNAEKELVAVQEEIDGCVFVCPNGEEVAVVDVYLDGTEVIVEVENEESGEVYTYAKQAFEDKFQIAL